MAAGVVNYTYTATAQSAGEEVKLEAYIIPAMDFTVETSDIDLDKDGPHTVTITNAGAWDLLVACSVTGSYADSLRLDGETWSSFNAIIERDSSREVEVELAVPDNYTEVSEQSGTIAFWAVEAR